MKLDSRIIKGKKPLTCFDAEEAKEFLGKECYFSNCRVHYKNLSNFKKFVSLTDYCIGALTAVMDLGDRVFDVDQQCNEFRYCLPCEWVNSEEPKIKWRPFTLDEFVKRFDLEVGTRVFLIRSKTTPVNQRRLLLTGIIQDKDPCVCGVYLGGCYFRFSDLFDMYDVRFGKNDWQPFGVEDKE